jgi:drug/metabolite transporter (DMT)-like permease
VTVALAIALFDEGLGVTQAAGGVLVLAAVVALQARGLSTVGRRVAAAQPAASTAARTPASEPA